jgi:GNAT superfamily N-acetyltransferase
MDWERAFKLLGAHHSEIKSTRKRPRLNPDIDRYMQLQKEDRLVLATARTPDDELIGYCVFFIYKHPHYAHTLCAMDDIHYVIPKYRHSGIWQRMMQAAVDEIKSRNVGMISIRVPEGNEYTEEMSAMGFDSMEKVYYKSLTAAWG